MSWVVALLECLEVSSLSLTSLEFFLISEMLPTLKYNHSDWMGLPLAFHMLKGILGKFDLGFQSSPLTSILGCHHALSR